jgi:Subtilase family/PA domain/Fibronectin type-III domain
VELAFLDAYNAGVVVAASAGNDGPTAATANHLSPWTISVAASTQTRTFQSTLTLTDGPATATFTGASITAGVGPLPIVFASAAPYSDAMCENPATAGLFTGKIVACERGTNARVDKGFNVKQGNAAGMVLYNPTLADVETDNHWLPAVHLADGTAFVAFLTAHPGASATIGAGVKAAGQGDVMAAFSSRGPAGLFIKPDVTAPGVQILAGDSPTPDATDLGPPGELFQAIAGTSMSSPHVAGAAILVRAEHPYWTPGQIKSALMGTAVTAVKKEDLTTPADPFDFGAGRIDVAAAVAAPLTFDESAADFFATSADPLHAIDLNIGSIDATVMPGLVTTTRVAKNPTNKTLTYAVSTTSPSHSSITVSPSKFTLAPGKSVTLHVTIVSTATIGTQQFGAIKIVTTVGVGSAAQIRRIHIPVAFVHAQGDVSLSQTCAPSTIKVGNTSVCTVTAENDSFSPQQVTVETRTDGSLKIVSASHTTIIDNHTTRTTAEVLEGAQPGIPSVAAGDSVFGYIPLDSLGVTPTPIGDEDIINFPTGNYLYNGVTYDSIGVDSNGYILAGEGTSADDVCCDLPSAASPDIPNDILAPFWTDLDGTDSDGIFVAELSDAGQTWLVVEHRVNVFHTTDLEVFQTWIGENDTQDISFAYDPTNLPTQPADVGQTFLVGAENGKGEGDMSAFIPTEDLVVTSSAAIPGDSLSYRVRVKGLSVGSGLVKTQMTASETLGLTIVRSTIAIKKK